MSPLRRLLGALTMSGALASAAVVLAPAAQAAGLVDLSSCDGATLSQPFAPWADFNYYKLAPGGDGSLTGWSLQGAASKTSGGEPWNVSGSANNSLSLSTGGSGTSPMTCVNAAYPTFRFFARTDSQGSTVAVSVVYDTALGQVTIPVGTVALSGGWSPSLPMTTLSPITGALSGGTAQVSLRFTEVSGSAQIDDVYVDPWRSG
jgi:hypothetical protein